MKFPHSISRALKRKADLCTFTRKVYAGVLRLFNSNSGQCEMKLYFLGGLSASIRAVCQFCSWNFHTKALLHTMLKYTIMLKLYFFLVSRKTFKLKERIQQRDYLNSKYSYLIILLNALKLSLFS